MPAACSCGGEVVLGSLRCARCGADARAAPALPGLSFADAIGHDVEAFVRERSPRFYRRAKILDRLAELCPEFVTWARQDEATRGPPPPVPREHDAEIDALCDEYVRLK